MITEIIKTDNSAAIDKVILSLDNWGYKNKPAGAEIGNITNRLQTGTSSHKQIEIGAIAAAIEKGCTVMGAILRDKQSESEDTDSRFIGQQLFYVDIDNDEKGTDGKKYKRAAAIDTPEQIRAIAAGAGLQPCIIAPSFSDGKQDPNGETIHKFHVCFASSEPIKDVKQSRQIIENLINLYGGGADIACKNPSRLLFGTTSDKEILYSSVANSPELLLNCGQPAEPAPIPESEPPQLQSSEPAPKASRAPKASGKTHKNSDFTTDIKENKTDPDILLQMIHPANIDYNTWLRVSAAYKLFDGHSAEVWDSWNRQYTSPKANYKADLKSFKALTGAGINKISLHAIAEQESPEEYNSYIKSLIAEHKPPKKSKRTQRAAADPAGAPSEQDGTPRAARGELIPLELPFERPAGYIDFAFEDEKGKKIIIPQLLAENFRQSCKYIFVRGADPTESVRRFWYEHGVYTPVADEYIKNALRDKIKVFGLTLCKKSYIEEAFYQLSIDNAFHADTELNADENIINFKNGLLHLDTMQITPHTPEFLSTIQIPCDYIPNLTLDNAPTFKRFIMHLANNDLDSVQSLIEFIGAAISNVLGAYFKKAIFLRGAGNCGKSQYILLLSHLLSLRYFGSASLESLESRFGKYTLYNRRVVGDPDIKFMKIAELETFKKITGGDNIEIESKGKNGFTYRYRGLLLFGCNNLPKFGGDRGEWVYNRMLLIQCGEPIPEPERDPQLLDKLLAEKEIIISVAIAALKRTIANGYNFTISESSKQLMSAYKVDNEIIRQFIEECCELRTAEQKRDNITQAKFFEAFVEWTRRAHIMRIPNAREFKKNIFDISQEAGALGEYKLHGGVRYYSYTLTEQAKRELRFFDTAAPSRDNPYYNNY